MNNDRVLKGFAAGLVGGLVGSWTMNQFQALMAKLMRAQQPSDGSAERQDSAQQQAENWEPATVKLAERISEP